MTDQSGFIAGYESSNVGDSYDTPNDSSYSDGHDTLQPQGNQFQHSGNNVPYLGPYFGFARAELADRIPNPGENLMDMYRTQEDHTGPLNPGIPTPISSHMYEFRDNDTYRPYTRNGLVAHSDSIFNQSIAEALSTPDNYNSNPRIERYTTEPGPWIALCPDATCSLGDPRFYTRLATETNSLEDRSTHSPPETGVPEAARVATIYRPFQEHDGSLDQYTHGGHQISTPSSYPMERDQGYLSYDTPFSQQGYQVRPHDPVHNQRDGYSEPLRTPIPTQLATPLSNAHSASMDFHLYNPETFQQPTYDVHPIPLTFSPGDQQILDGRLSMEHIPPIVSQIPQSAYVNGWPNQVRETDNMVGTVPNAAAYGNPMLHGSPLHNQSSTQGSLPWDEQSATHSEHMPSESLDSCPQAPTRRESAPEIMLASDQNPGNTGSFQVLDSSMQPVKKRRTRYLSPSGRIHAKEVRRRGACQECRRKKCKV